MKNEHPLKAEHIFTCHSSLREESGVCSTQILRAARSKKWADCFALSEYPLRSSGKTSSPFGTWVSRVLDSAGAKIGIFARLVGDDNGGVVLVGRKRTAQGYCSGEHNILDA